MNKIRSYRDLIVWQKAMDLVVLGYQIVKSLPKNEEYCLSSQLRNCLVSIPSNIAEGYGRSHKNDYCRFLDIARGSLYEFQTQIEVAIRLEYIEKISFDTIFENTMEIEKMLNKLISSLRNGK
jgi:four helix bundle protein